MDLKYYRLSLSLFFLEKRETEKPLVAASGSVATDFLHYDHYTPKNGKLPSVKQSHFLNGAPFSSFSPADATRKEQEVTHLINVKALRFHPCLYFLVESTVGAVDVFSKSIYKKLKLSMRLDLAFAVNTSWCS